MEWSFLVSSPETCNNCTTWAWIDYIVSSCLQAWSHWGLSENYLLTMRNTLRFILPDKMIGKRFLSEVVLKQRLIKFQDLLIHTSRLILVYPLCSVSIVGMVSLRKKNYFTLLEDKQLQTFISSKGLKFDTWSVKKSLSFVACWGYKTSYLFTFSDNKRK